MPCLFWGVAFYFTAGLFPYYSLFFSSQIKMRLHMHSDVSADFVNGNCDLSSIYSNFYCARRALLGCRSWVIPLTSTCAYLNTAFNGGTCQQNMYFNMYTTISKQQEGPTCKNSKCKMFHNAKFNREALAWGSEGKSYFAGLKMT